jgi:hypothetical protein
MLRSAMMSYDNAEDVCGGCKSDAAMRRDAKIVEGAKQRRWIAVLGCRGHDTVVVVVIVARFKLFGGVIT